jgi:hypothetical protein
MPTRCWSSTDELARGVRVSDSLGDTAECCGQANAGPAPRPLIHPLLGSTSEETISGSSALDGSSPLVRGPSGWLRRSAAPSFLERFLACFSSRRSRSLLSRFSFAIVVFFLPVEAMHVRSFVDLERVVGAQANGVERLLRRRGAVLGADWL